MTTSHRSHGSQGQIKRLSHNSTAKQAAGLTPARFAATLHARGRAVA